MSASEIPDPIVQPSSEAPLKAEGVTRRGLGRMAAATALGMVVENRFGVVGKFLGLFGSSPTQAVHPNPPAPVDTSVAPSSSEAQGYQFLETKDFPPALQEVHRAVSTHPKLSEWYKKYVVSWDEPLQDFRRQVEKVSNEETFGVRSSYNLKFPKREFEDRKKRYLAEIDRYTKNREQHLLALLHVVGILQDPLAIERVLKEEPPKYEANTKLSGGLFGDKLAGIHTAEQDLSRAHTHGEVKGGRSTLHMDLDATAEGKFATVLTHEALHAFQNKRKLGQQKVDHAPEMIEFVTGPIYKCKRDTYLRTEFLYEGVTELLNHEALQLEGEEAKYMSYQPIVALSFFLMKVNQKAVMQWYRGDITNQDAYNLLAQDLTGLGVPTPMVTKLLNMAFQDKPGSLDEQNKMAEGAASVLAFVLERRGVKPSDGKEKLPPFTQKLLEQYDFGSLVTKSDHELGALCEQDRERVIEKRDGKTLSVRLSVIGTYVYFLKNTANGLSALAMQYPHSKRREILKECIKVEPKSAIHHARLGKSFEDSTPRDFGEFWEEYEFVRKNYDEKTKALETALALDSKQVHSKFLLGIAKLQFALIRLEKGSKQQQEAFASALVLIKGALAKPEALPADYCTTLESFYFASQDDDSTWAYCTKQYPEVQKALKAFVEQGKK